MLTFYNTAPASWLSGKTTRASQVGHIQQTYVFRAKSCNFQILNHSQKHWKHPSCAECGSDWRECGCFCIMFAVDLLFIVLWNRNSTQWMKFVNECLMLRRYRVILLVFVSDISIKSRTVGFIWEKCNNFASVSVRSEEMLNVGVYLCAASCDVSSLRFL